MKATIGGLLGLVFSLTAAAEPLIEGRARLTSGAPAAGAQVRLFDRTDLRAAPLAATTDRSGQFTLPLATLAGALPERFELGANYPNPFNPATMIPYRLPTAMYVRLEVFNLLGQRMATLVDGERPAGFHTARWDATDAAGQAVGAGVYLYRFSGEGMHATRRMLLIDGQAGIPSGAGGSHGLEGDSGAGKEGDPGPVYGLTVSGPGLVPYVEPAFQVKANMAPLDLVVAAPGSDPAAKAASSGRILGDVDNTGSVDFFDAVLVALYSRDSSIVMPNNGDISLGDVDADGQVDLSDAWAIAAWLNDPSDPSLPAGIGEPAGPAASLSPDPSTVTFADDGAWHRFTVDAAGPVTVIANPAGATPRLEITTRSGRGNFCPAEADDDVAREDGRVVYLAGCATGTATVELRRPSDGTVLNTYTFEVTGSPADLVVESVSVSDSTLTPGQSFTLRATVRNQGTGQSEATTLRYYRSTNRTISTRDTQVGTDPVGALGASRTSAESISLTAPSSEGTWYYGACAVSVAGESAGNNCSAGIRVRVEADTTPVTIPDANLRAAIGAALGKASDAPINRVDMKTLTNLEALRADISDLTGLESATNLTELDLEFNNITDLSPLSGLNNLTELYLRKNDFTDMSPLSGLNNLTELYLRKNDFTDMSPLSGLNNLEWLGLSHNDLTDVSPLSGLTNLEWLWLQSNDLTDVSPLSGLTNLEFLDLWWNDLTDVSALSGLNNLWYLGLSNNDLTDLSPLGGFTNISQLDLAGNFISDVSGLLGLSNRGKFLWLELNENPLNDTSINDHIPVLQRAGVDVVFEYPLKSLAKISGDDQLGTPGVALAHPFVVEVRDQNGFVYEGVPVTFAVTAGGGRLSHATVSTDDHGQAWSTLTLGSGAGPNTVEASAIELERTVTFRVRSPGEPEGFNIELVFQDTVTQAQEALFRYAAGRWMSVFTAGLPDQETSSGEQVDDLRINVYVENIDTFLGQAWHNELRETSLLPITGGLTIDLPHLEKTKAVLPTILHEMGHVLGIGTLWTRLGFLQTPSFPDPGVDTHFNGPLAVEAFDAAGGGNYTGGKVPVENEGSGRDTHWRKPVLDGELMGYGGGKNLSAITIQSLADLGYGVDVTQADEYTLPEVRPSAKMISGAGPLHFGEGRLADPDRVRGRGGGLRDGRLFRRYHHTPNSIDLHLCGFAPGREPIYVVDEQGRIVRTLQRETRAD